MGGQDKMKIGFIGCGAFNSGTHIPNAAANPNFEITAFCDLNTKRLAELRDKYHPRYVTSDMNEFFKDPEIEMVVCGTRPDFRLPVMELAVKHGKHLFVEKPMCYRLEDVNPMVALISGSRIKFMVGFNRPYSPMMQAIKPVYQKLKKDSVTIVYRIVGEAQLWPANHKREVLVEKQSTLVHEATHIFDLLNWLVDMEPTRVFTAGEGHMDDIVTLNYPDHVTAVIIHGDNSTTGFPKERLEINTNHATIIGDNFIEMQAVGGPEGLVRQVFPWSMEGKEHQETGFEALRLFWEWRASVTDEEKKYGYYYNRMPRMNKGHAFELESFRRMIRENRPVQTDVYRGALAELIAWEAYESWKTGQARPLDFSYLRK